MTPLDQAAVARVSAAIEDLVRCRPDDWPELLPGIAGEVCGFDTRLMDILAAAAIQVAGAAQRQALEHRGQEPDGPGMDDDDG